jgi:hypothetical protein
MARGARQGLVEVLLALCLLALGAAGALALWGEELAALAGLRPAQPAAAPGTSR